MRCATEATDSPLLLSMLAAFQAPIIMMSQNRQAARDRIAAARDYETNLRAERKIDELIALLREARDVGVPLRCAPPQPTNNS